MYNLILVIMYTPLCIIQLTCIRTYMQMQMQIILLPLPVVTLTWQSQAACARRHLEPVQANSWSQDRNWHEDQLALP